MDNRRAPAPERFAGQMKFRHLGQLREKRMDRSPQMANAFAMNNPHPEDAPRPALGQIIRDEVLYLARREAVQVKHPIDGKLDRLVIAHRRHGNPANCAWKKKRTALHSGSRMKIRKARKLDAACIADFNLRLAWETEQLRLDPARVRRGVRALLRDPAKGTYFVAEASGTIAGQLMITYEWSDWRNADFWWIQSVYVAAEFRQKGVFRALYQHVKTLCDSRKEVCGLRLYVEVENQRAQRAYLNLGMHESRYQFFEYEKSRPGPAATVSPDGSVQHVRARRSRTGR